MKGIIKDSGLDNLVQVVLKPGLAIPAPDSPWWPRSYQATAYSARYPTKALSDCDGVEKELTQQPSNDTVGGIEAGVAQDVVGWYGPDDPEVFLNSALHKFVTDTMT